MILKAGEIAAARWLEEWGALHILSLCVGGEGGGEDGLWVRQWVGNASSLLYNFCMFSQDEPVGSAITLN